MKILVITQYFWPEDFRINELVVELQKKGHEIEVLTGRPNYPEGRVFDIFNQNKKNFNHFHNIRVFRCPVPARGKSSLRLLINYASFIVFGSVYALYLRMRKKYDLFFVFEPSPITVCLPAIAAKKIFKTPIIFWVLDLWPETLQAVKVLDKNSLLNSLIKRLVNFIYKNCDMILGQSWSFVSKIKGDCPKDTKVRYFPNWVESSYLNSGSSTNLKFNNEKAKIFFAGNIGEAQDFETILVGFSKLANLNLAELHIFGDGRRKDWVHKKIHELNLECSVILHGRFPQQDMLEILSQADALLVSLRSDPILDMTIPGKLQTYLSIGKPILAIASGECANIINESKSGYASKPGNSDEFYRNILFFLESDQNSRKKMGHNGIIYAKKHFDKDKVLNNLNKFFEEVI